MIQSMKNYIKEIGRARYEQFVCKMLCLFRLVVWRKGNKAVIRLHVTPRETENGNEEESVVVGFVMQHGYVNTIAALEHKSPQKVDVRVKLYLTIGQLASEA